MRSQRQVFHLILAILLFVAGCGDGSNRLEYNDRGPELDGPFITDHQGRVLILHGVNVMSSAKSDPLRMPDITQADARRMVHDWGFNFVRFLIFWDAVEPQPGQYDQDYFDRVEERLNWFADVGMYVVLDMHQDVYAQRFCCDGAPEWAIRDDGEPFQMQPLWWMNYFQPAVMRAFDNFWQIEGQHQEVQEHYIEAWAAVVQRFKNHPAVIGYDLMNEPSPGSKYDPAELMGRENPNGPSPAFDRDYLQACYQRIIHQIREVDKDHWIFYEPRYGAPSNGLPSYLEKMQDPRPGPARLAYFPHLYSLRVEATGKYLPGDPTLPGWEQYRSEEAVAFNAPLLCGEWGVTYGTENQIQLFRDTCAMMDRLMAGWAYWSYDPGGFGFLNPDKSERETAAELVRVYPQRIAGIPKNFSYDPERRTFIMDYYEREGVTARTEVYVPVSRIYPEMGPVYGGYGYGVPPEFGFDEDGEIFWIKPTGCTSLTRVYVTPQGGPYPPMPPGIQPCGDTASPQIFTFSTASQ